MASKLKWVLIVVGSFFGLVGLIVLGISKSPLFTLLILAIVTIAVVFMATEDGLSHGAIEYENRFWSLMAMLLACSLLLCPDSPFMLSDNRIALPIIIFFTYFVHLSDRYLRNIVMNKIPDLKRNRSKDFGCLEERAAAHDKVVALEKLVNQIDNSLISSTFMNIFAIASVLKWERGIISIFTEANPRELNFIVQTISIARVMYKIKDHKILNIYNRTKLLELLSIKKIKDMNTVSKTYLLHGFQNMKLSAHPCSETYVKSIIQSCTLNDLCDLKCQTDSKGDINSMHKLIYSDIKDKKIKSDILDYIKGQANTQMAHMLIGSKRGKHYEKRPWRKIISDIDDTLQCSGGSWPAGIHTAYPKHALYPGVLAFYRELDLGVTGADDWEDTLQGNLVFLSARPHVYKALSEDESYKKFRYLRKYKGLYTCPTLLAGGLDSGTKFVLGGDPEPVAEKKFIKFMEYIALYPEFKYIFVGDNGQGDARTVEMLMDKPGYSGYLTRAYIHEVQPVRSTYAKKSSTRSSYCSHIYYFRNYIDAGIDAYHRKLIRLSGLRRIMLEAVRDFKAIHWMGGHHQRKDSKSEKETISVHEIELKRDIQLRDLNLYIRKGNKILATEGVAPVALIEFESKHSPGNVVQTPYGKGIVNKFRPMDGMYEIQLLWDASGASKPINAVLRSSSVKPVPLPPEISKSVSIFRSKTAAQTLVVSSLETHLKSIVFSVNLSIKKLDSKSKSTKSMPVFEFDFKSMCESSYKEQDRFIGEQYLRLDSASKRLATSLTKPSDWDSYVKQFQSSCASQVNMDNALRSLFTPVLTTGNQASDQKIVKSEAIVGSTLIGAQGTSSSTASATACVPLIAKSEQQIQSIVGSLVWTAMGIGWIKGFRDTDGMILVLIDIGNSSMHQYYPKPTSPFAKAALLSEVAKSTPQMSANDSRNKPFYARCYMNRASIVLLTDPLITSAYQQSVANYYLQSKFADAANRLEVLRQAAESGLFAASDFRRQELQEMEYKSPSRFKVAAISTMRALGIISSKSSDASANSSTISAAAQSTAAPVSLPFPDAAISASVNDSATADGAAVLFPSPEDGAGLDAAGDDIAADQASQGVACSNLSFPPSTAEDLTITAIPGMYE